LSVLWEANKGGEVMTAEQRLYGATDRVDEIRATIADMRQNELRAMIPQDEALFLIEEIDRLRAAGWRNTVNGMPPRNQRVLAYCEGSLYHSGASWFRNGYAFMVHHDHNAVGPGWARSFYDDACRQLGADELIVIAWMPLEKPQWATR